MPSPESILSRLVQNNVEFVVIGGLAAAAHGCTLVTVDLDICCDFTQENLDRLWTAVAGLHPVHRMTPGRLPLDLTPEKCSTLRNLYLDTDYGQLDCLSEVLGIGSFDDVKMLSESISLSSGDCNMLTIDGMIQAKKAMDRPRDKEAVLQLEAIKERLAQQ